MILLIVTLVILIVALANVVFWPRIVRAVDDNPAKRISILIPARNEESNLPDCLASALRQGDSVIEILVYNDHSTDGTSRVIEEFADRDARVRSVAPIPLEEGWCGKNFACARLASAARGEILLFIDADTRLSDSAAALMATEMERRQLTLLSCWPRLEMRGFWEQALMPVLNFVVFSIFPAPLSIVLQNPSLALAHGACMMFDRKTYHLLGGHAAVRDQIFEDVRIAQLWRMRGARSLCLDGRQIVRVRMYNSFGEIWRGFQKNFYPAFRRESSFWAFMAFHSVFFLLPFFLLAVRPSMVMLLAVASIFAIRVALAARFRHPLWAAIIHPVSESIMLALGLSSWWRCRSGQGVSWKGREYLMKVESKK